MKVPFKPTVEGESQRLIPSVSATSNFTAEGITPAYCIVILGEKADIPGLFLFLNTPMIPASKPH